jgi:hypothetical protein
VDSKDISWIMIAILWVLSMMEKGIGDRKGIQINFDFIVGSMRKWTV